MGGVNGNARSTAGAAAAGRQGAGSRGPGRALRRSSNSPDEAVLAALAVAEGVAHAPPAHRGHAGVHRILWQGGRAGAQVQEGFAAGARAAFGGACSWINP